MSEIILGIDGKITDDRGTLIAIGDRPTIKFMNALDRFYDEAYKKGWADAREVVNKQNRKFNKYPKRMISNKHRYHIRTNKKFINCPLCQN
jgi:hypothetical protein